MKKSTIVITTITMMFAFTALSCERSDKMERAQIDVIEAERDLSIAQTEVESEVRIFRQETANDIRKNNLAIADIKRRIQDEDAESRAAHQVRVTELERKNNDLKRQMDNYSVTNRDHWESFKDQFSTNMDDLGNSLNNFFSRSSTTSRN